MSESCPNINFVLNMCDSRSPEKVGKIFPILSEYFQRCPNTCSPKISNPPVVFFHHIAT